MRACNFHSLQTFYAPGDTKARLLPFQSQSASVSGLKARSSSCSPGRRRTQPLSGLGSCPHGSQDWGMEQHKTGQKMHRNGGCTDDAPPAALTQPTMSWGGGVAHGGGPSATTVRWPLSLSEDL